MDSKGDTLSQSTEINNLRVLTDSVIELTIQG